MPRCDPSRGCRHKCQPGLVRLLSDTLKKYPRLQNWGCDSCRRVAGSTSYSLHAEGRAIDVGVPGWAKSDGDKLFRETIANADALGLQEILWYGDIWSCSRPYIRRHRYASSSNDTLAHRNHVHIGLNWDGALMQTKYFSAGFTPVQPTSSYDRLRVVSVDSYLNAYYFVRAAGDVVTNGVGRGDLLSLKIPRDSASTAIVDIATCPGGYILLGRDGAIFAFGKAQYYGALNSGPLWSPPTALAVRPDGKGYWIILENGAVFKYGSAGAYGSAVNIPLTGKIVDAVSTKTGKGYWLFESNGGVFSFGDARFYGSLGNLQIVKPICAGVRTPSGAGYWLIAEDGGVFSFGDARFYGSYPALPAEWRKGKRTIVGAAPYLDGYLMAGSDGAIYRFHSKN